MSAATIVRWRGSSGYSAGVIPIATIRNAANTDLVTNSFVTRWMLRRIRRPSATIPGNGGEVAVDEHHVGDRLRHLRAGALGDREPRCLQGRHVVDSVADHRDVAPLPAQRLDDPALAVGRDAPDHAQLRHELVERSVVRREVVARRPDPQRSGMPASSAIDADGVRCVARQHLHVDALLEEIGNRLARVRAQRLGEDRDPERPQRRWAGVGVVRKRGRRRPECDYPPAGRLLRGRDGGELTEREQLRRAEHEAVAAQPKAAPAAA